MRAHHNIMPRASIQMSVSGASNAISGKIGHSVCVHRPLRTNWPSWDGERRMSKFEHIFEYRVGARDAFPHLRSQRIYNFAETYKIVESSLVMLCRCKNNFM